MLVLFELDLFKSKYIPGQEDFFKQESILLSCITQSFPSVFAFMYYMVVQSYNIVNAATFVIVCNKNISLRHRKYEENICQNCKTCK